MYRAVSWDWISTVGFEVRLPLFRDWLMGMNRECLIHSECDSLGRGAGSRPAAFGTGLGLAFVHQGGAMFIELRPLQWFRHVVSFHFVCWAVLYRYIALFDLVGNKEISVVDMSRPLAHTLVAIFLQLDCAGVVLKDYCGLGRITLFLQKIFGPQYLGHAVVDCHEFRFR